MASLAPEVVHLSVKQTMCGIEEYLRDTEGDSVFLPSAVRTARDLSNTSQ